MAFPTNTEVIETTVSSTASAVVKVKTDLVVYPLGLR